jgi:hypothetical protein
VVRRFSGLSGLDREPHGIATGALAGARTLRSILHNVFAAGTPIPGPLTFDQATGELLPTSTTTG